MSALYGLVPNMVQQYATLRPAVDTQSMRETVNQAADIAVSQATKVAPPMASNASSDTNVSADQRPDKTLPKKSPPNRDDLTPTPTAESKVVATQNPLTPSDLADQKAKDLARAREHADHYREYKARTEVAQSGEPPAVSGEQADQPRMDVRIALVDEIPDRPAPRFGVPTV